MDAKGRFKQLKVKISLKMYPLDKICGFRAENRTTQVFSLIIYT